MSNTATRPSPKPAHRRLPATTARTWTSPPAAWGLTSSSELRQQGAATDTFRAKRQQEEFQGRRDGASSQRRRHLAFKASQRRIPVLPDVKRAVPSLRAATAFTAVAWGPVTSCTRPHERLPGAASFLAGAFALMPLTFIAQGHGGQDSLDVSRI